MEKTIFDAPGELLVVKRNNGWYPVCVVCENGILSPKEALALADAIYDDQGFGWLPYPENKPRKGEYFVTTEDKNGKQTLFYAIYSTVKNTWLSPFGGLLEDDRSRVVAYCTPRPYQPED